MLSTTAAGQRWGVGGRLKKGGRGNRPVVGTPAVSFPKVRQTCGNFKVLTRPNPRTKRKRLRSSVRTDKPCAEQIYESYRWCSTASLQSDTPVGVGEADRPL